MRLIMKPAVLMALGAILCSNAYGASGVTGTVTIDRANIDILVEDNVVPLHDDD